MEYFRRKCFKNLLKLVATILIEYSVLNDFLNLVHVIRYFMNKQIIVLTQQTSDFQYLGTYPPDYVVPQHSLHQIQNTVLLSCIRVAKLLLLMHQLQPDPNSTACNPTPTGKIKQSMKRNETNC